MRGGDFRFTYDRAFRQTIDSCAAPRASATGTWITAPMRDAYCELHTAGAAHSFECWQADRLVGGIYGVAVGQVFFGESMFSAVTDGSKMCLANLSAKLIEWDYQLIDCQVHNAHLQSLGATLIPRPDFTAMLTSLCAQAPANAAWRENDE
jgi:leucyl/phenylalanyl-tRNA--protein transferase